jgi:hypothetical protein
MRSPRLIGVPQLQLLANLAVIHRGSPEYRLIISRWVGEVKVYEKPIKTTESL